MSAVAHGSRVLIVDDDPAQRQTLSDLLRDEGLDPFTCGTGGEALDVGASERFAAAILDLRLPDLDGLEVLERFQSSKNYLPVIVHTAYGSFETARDALNLGAYAYLEKVGDPGRLIREVHHAVDEKLAQEWWQLDGCLRSITENVSDRILQLDDSHTVTFANGGFPEVTLDDLRGSSLDDWVVPECRVRLREALKAVFDGHERRFELLLGGGAGISRKYDCCAAPVSSGGRVARALLVARESPPTVPQLLDVEDRERHQLASDLHDGLGQNLCLLSLKLATLLRHPLTDELRQDLNEIADLVDQAGSSVRSLVLRMNPPKDVDLVPALHLLAEDALQRYNLRVVFENDQLPKSLDPPVSRQLYRVIRELLINVARHSGAKLARVRLCARGDHLHVVVEDEGRGFDVDRVTSGPGAEGFGLLSARERMQRLGGMMTIHSTPGAGTAVWLVAPMASDSDSSSAH